MTSAFSWQNSISLWPASFRIPRPNLPLPPGVSWLPTFAFQSPIMKRISFGGVSSKRSCAAAAKSFQLCLTLCDPVDGSPGGSSVPGILQARIQEWVAISFSLLYSTHYCFWSGSLRESSLTLSNWPDLLNFSSAKTSFIPLMSLLRMKQTLDL